VSQNTLYSGFRKNALKIFLNSSKSKELHFHFLRRLVQLLWDTSYLDSSWYKGYSIKTWDGEGSFCFRKSCNPHWENQYFQRFKCQKKQLKGERPLFLKQKTPLPTMENSWGKNIDLFPVLRPHCICKPRNLKRWYFN